MNIENQFSEEEIKYMSGFMKGMERAMKLKRGFTSKNASVIGVIALAVFALLNLCLALMIGADCGMSISNVLSCFFERIEMFRTYEGCEMVVKERVGNAVLQLTGVIFVILVHFMSEQNWKANQILCRCWQLLSSQKKDEIAE